ncbi:hypothetical protein [Acaryochloris marina]|uniref:hypothetical protein n=1 Tax=Acaryochloris marina TaxID=155978 RepID=UPI0021C34009|nr:hypothetical protein [Acaryochloris marina]
MMRQHKSTAISKLIITTLLFFTLSTGSQAVQLANKPTLSEQQDRIFDIALVASSLGGKALIAWLNRRQKKSDKGDDDDA